MFVAIQKQKTGVDLPEIDSEGNIINITPEYKDHKAFLASTKEELENNEFIEYERIEEYSFAEMYNGVIYVDEKELTAAKETYIRSVRNSYLVQYVDSIVSNPLRWADMSEEKQNEIKDYRRYLLDYTEFENWREHEPLNFDYWLEQKTTEDTADKQTQE